MFNETYLYDHLANPLLPYMYITTELAIAATRPNVASRAIASLSANNWSRFLHRSDLVLTEPPFKLLYHNCTHQFFCRKKHQFDTELSNYVWKDMVKHLLVHPEIQQSHYTLLNERYVLVSKCRHRNKYYLTNYTERLLWSTTQRRAPSNHLSPIYHAVSSPPPLRLSNAHFHTFAEHSISCLQIT